MKMAHIRQRKGRWTVEIRHRRGQQVNLNQNRKEVIDAMSELEKTGLLEIRPRDVVKHCGYTAQSKDAGRISKTMLRMVNNFEIAKGEKFGTYKLVSLNL